MHNPLLLSALHSTIAAQILKIPINYLIKCSGNWQAALKPGGMPSSHTSLMVGLTIATLLKYGLNNPYFAISTAVSLIVIYDAVGVRRQAGQHAIVLNELTATIDTLNKKLSTEIDIKPTRLKEVIGHSPIAVLGGIVVGIVIGLFIVR
ncbi:divergent PAP2 family protein [Desulfosporosinus sp. FKA]|uniref:divergent PAP2 family protein n=1 Tax=Desulfosporosinus sp. FKA TaxID=1969834 RepID=UPI0015562AA3|nr:divergent PAP2 family protein [Desulfosporosinus sp. FKA]